MERIPRLGILDTQSDTFKFRKLEFLKHIMRNSERYVTTGSSRKIGGKRVLGRQVVSWLKNLVPDDYNKSI